LPTIPGLSTLGGWLGRSATPSPPAVEPVAKAERNPGIGSLGTESGVSGIPSFGGIFLDPVPQLRDLSGRRARELYEEMVAEDATVAACYYAIVLTVLGVAWRTAPADAGPEAQAEAEWLDGVLFQDMSHSWSDTLTDVLTMVKHGFSLLEIVYKRRVGPQEADPSRRSRFDDGRIGVRKLAGRHQLSISRWLTDDAGGVQGAVQRPPLGAGEIPIPIERLLLFRLARDFGNPESHSLLRACVRPYLERKRIGQIEAAGIERDLTGLPNLAVPPNVAKPKDGNDQAVRAASIRLLEEIKLGRSGGLLLSSETYPNPDGSPSNVKMWDLTQLGTPGSKPVDVDKAQSRRTADIMTAFFTQFLLLGGSSSKGGNRALSEDQSDFFVQSVTVLLTIVKETVNLHLVPRLWALNGLHPALMPRVEHDPVRDVSIGAIAAMLTSMAAAGAPIGGDVEAVNYIRRRIGMPEEAIEDPRAAADMETDEAPPEDVADVVVA
jgi:hypothetical protein